MPLTDTNLVVRYYFDEAASGTSPTSIADLSGVGVAYDLDDIGYDSGGMDWTEDSGNRGIEGHNITGQHYARRAIDDVSDKFRDAVDGHDKFTFELVYRIDALHANVSRVFAVNNDVSITTTTTGRFGIFASPTELQVLINEHGAGYAGFTVGGRVVIHAVIDTDQVLAADRMRVWEDLVELTPSVEPQVNLNEDETIPTGYDLICMNRRGAASFDRPLDGVLYYAALYTGILSEEDRENNFNILTSNDDASVPETTSTKAIQTTRSILRW